MNQIRPWLWIGAWLETRNHARLQMHGITAMLHLAANSRHPGITTQYLAVADGVPLPAAQLRAGVAFVLAEHTRGATVLIACGAGISRSATFATAVLKEAEDLSLLQAFTAVRTAHPPALPHYLLWESLCQYYGEDVPIQAILFP